MLCSVSQSPPWLHLLHLCPLFPSLFMLSSHTSFLPVIQTSSIFLCQDLHTCLYYKYLNTHSPLSGLLKCHLLRKLLLGLLSKISTPLSLTVLIPIPWFIFLKYTYILSFKFWLSSVSPGLQMIFMEPKHFWSHETLVAPKIWKMDSIYKHKYNPGSIHFFIFFYFWF